MTLASLMLLYIAYKDKGITMFKSMKVKGCIA